MVSVVDIWASRSSTESAFEEQDPLASETSKSPIRGDVKEKNSSSLSKRETDGGLHPAESHFRRGAGLGAYCGQNGQFAVCTRWCHDSKVIRRLRFWKLRKQKRWLWWVDDCFHRPISTSRMLRAIILGFSRVTCAIRGIKTETLGTRGQLLSVV